MQILLAQFQSFSLSCVCNVYKEYENGNLLTSQKLRYLSILHCTVLEASSSEITTNFLEKRQWESLFTCGHSMYTSETIVFKVGFWYIP